MSAACLPRLPCCSVLWLLRFPPYGEQNIRMQAASQGVDPCRIIFTGEGGGQWYGAEG